MGIKGPGLLKGPSKWAIRPPIPALMIITHLSSAATYNKIDYNNEIFLNE